MDLMTARRIAHAIAHSSMRPYAIQLALDALNEEFKHLVWEFEDEPDLHSRVTPIAVSWRPE
jgi:hypothetical protein